MLSHLRVRNFALIKDLNMAFHPKMNIITGETGAGKSILLGALGLILGERADVKSLGNLDDKCIVEGTFDITGYGLEPFFAENELDFDTTTIVRREITEAGKSRAFINDTPVGLNTLKELGDQLVSLHSQHETLSLNDRNFQLSVVDTFAGHSAELKEYKELYRSFRESEKRLNILLEEEAAVKKDLDYSSFLYGELKEADLQENEQEQLEKEQELLSHADEIKQNSLNAYHLLSESEMPVIDQLTQLRAIISNAAKNDERLAALVQRVDSATIELKDIARELNYISDTVQADEERLYNINQRLQLIYNLVKKHQATGIEELLQIQEQLAQKLDKASGMGDEIKHLQENCLQMQKELGQRAEKISKSRKAQVDTIQQNIAALLEQVGMPNARIAVEITDLPSNGLNETGKDAVSFMFSSNPGSAFQPLNKVASGGELSRLMLAIKSLVAGNIKLPTLIFDEIDTGISGEVAGKTGRLMKKLAENHQVISVTHLPQIAGAGHRHFFVYKEVKNNFTETSIKQLSENERVEEIAKMLSGDRPSEFAMANARELLALN